MDTLQRVESALRTHIQQSAGMVPQDLQIKPTDPQKTILDLVEDYEVRIVSNSKTVPGYITPGQKDTLFEEDPVSFDKATKARVAQAIVDKEAQGEYLGALKKFRFGFHTADSEEQTVYTPDGKYLLQDSCNACRGRGKTTCGICHGSGEERCARCSGSGSVSRTVSVQVGQRVEHKTVRERCGYCYLGLHRCGSCAGMKEVNCRPCGTTGVLTTVWWLTYVAKLKARTVPHNDPGYATTLKQFVDQLDLEDIQSEFDTLYGPAITASEDGKTVRRTFEAETVYVDTHVSRTGSKNGVGVRMLGNKLRIIDSEGLIDLVAGSAIDEAVREDGRDPLDVIAALAKIPLVNKVLALADKRGANPKDIAEQLQHSTIPQRISSVIGAAFKAAKAREKLSAPWCLGTAMLSSMGVAAFTHLVVGTSKGYVIGIAAAASFLAALMTNSFVRSSVIETARDSDKTSKRGKDAAQAWGAFMDGHGIFPVAIPVGAGLLCAVLATALLWFVL